MKQILFVAVVAIGLIGCRQTPPAPTPAAPATAPLCDATKVQDVIGKPRSEALAEDARVRAGAEIVRYLTPNMIVTMEYRADRLNLTVGTTDVIGSAACG